MSTLVYCQQCGNTAVIVWSYDATHNHWHCHLVWWLLSQFINHLLGICIHFSYNFFCSQHFNTSIWTFHHLKTGLLLLFQSIWGELSIIFCKPTFQHQKTDFNLLEGIVHVRGPKINITISIWHPGSETQQSTIFWVHLGAAQINPTDATFKLNSLWIIFVWREVQFNFGQKGLVEMSFTGKHFTYILGAHFRACTWVKKLNQYFHFYQCRFSPSPLYKA